MKWKYRYVVYALIFAIVGSFVLLAFVDFPINFITYIPWVVIIVYDFKINIRSYLKNRRDINERFK